MTNAERLTAMETKLDENARRLQKVEKKTDATHDAVLKLPHTLADEFITKAEHRALSKRTKNVEKAIYGVGAFVIMAVVTALLARVVV